LLKPWHRVCVAGAHDLCVVYCWSAIGVPVRTTRELSFSPSQTGTIARTDRYQADGYAATCILLSGSTVGFYVLRDLQDHFSLDHFYILPEYQGQGMGASVLESITQLACVWRKPVRLGALRGSRSNDFYQRHGFVQSHESEFDIYYQYTP